MTTPTPAERAAEKIREIALTNSIDGECVVAHFDETRAAQIITREYAPMVEACRDALWTARSHVNDLGHLEQIDAALSLLNPKVSSC